MNPRYFFYLDLYNDSLGLRALYPVFLCYPYTKWLPREVQSSDAPEQFPVASHCTHSSALLALSRVFVTFLFKAYRHNVI